MNKTLIIIAVLTCFAWSSSAQEFRGLDKSPMDKAYLPDNFAHDRKFAPEKNLGESAIIILSIAGHRKKGE